MTVKLLCGTRRQVGGFERALFLSFGKFCSRREERVARRIQRRFARVLKHADYEADADDLHCQIVVDAET